MAWNPEFPFEPPGFDPIVPRYPAPPPLEPNIPAEGVPEDFLPASPYQPPSIPGTVLPFDPSPPIAPPPVTGGDILGELLNRPHSTRWSTPLRTMTPTRVRGRLEAADVHA